MNMAEDRGKLLKARLEKLKILMPLFQWHIKVAPNHGDPDDHGDDVEDVIHIAGC